MTTCGHQTTTQRHHWACARYAGHPPDQHRYQRAEPAPEDEPHPNNDWTELAP